MVSNDSGWFWYSKIGNHEILGYPSVRTLVLTAGVPDFRMTCFFQPQQKCDGIAKTPSKKLELYGNGTRPFFSLGWVSKSGDRTLEECHPLQITATKIQWEPPWTPFLPNDFKVITTRNLSPSQAHPIFFDGQFLLNFSIDFPWWITESLDTHSPDPLSYPKNPKRWPTMAHIPMIIPSKIAMMWFDYP